MSVSKDIINKYNANYFAETGRVTEHFICPITLQPVPEGEVIKGHLLNQAFFEASGRTVPQWKRVDGFFGETVEADLIDHLNFKDKSDEQLLSGADEFFVEFANGTRADAFYARSRAAKGAKGRFPKVPFYTGRGTVDFYVKVEHGDPRLQLDFGLRRKETFAPSHWLAAALKSAYLTLFGIFGYKVCYDSMSGLVRQSLASFYETHGSAGAEEHFKDFKNSFRILGLYDPAREYSPSIDYTPYGLDTITDNEFLSYDALGGTHFAMGVLFSINGMTATVAIPSCVDPTHAAKVWAMYHNFMSENPAFKYTIRRVRFTGDKWMKFGQPIGHRYFDTLSD